MSRDNIKELIKLEYENGATMVFLSNKYNVSVGTIKTWSFTQKWIKKKPNIKTKTNKKPNQQNQKINNKDIEIKKDILNEMPRQEVMEKHGIKKSSYYKKAKNIRQIRQERTEEYLERIVDEVYKGDIYKILKNTEVAKVNLIIKTTNELSSKEKTNIKKIQEYEKAYQTIKKMGMDLMRTGKMLTPYELLEIDQQLSNEEIQLEKIEVEKSKLKDKVKETENESKSLDLLNKLVGDSNATNK